MGLRGPKSASQMSVAAVADHDVINVKRLSAPVHLSDAERTVWLEIVNDHPADTFRPTHVSMLEHYCRHVVLSRVLADQIMHFDSAWINDDDGLKRYDRLLTMHERETRAASALATRLRITRQSLEHNETAANKFKKTSAARKPWETARTVDAE
jgi:hypothetical protein